MGTDVSMGLLSQGRYLTHRHPCLQWDSNPRSQCLSGRRPRGHCDRERNECELWLRVGRQVAGVSANSAAKAAYKGMRVWMCVCVGGGDLAVGVVAPETVFFFWYELQIQLQQFVSAIRVTSLKIQTCFVWDCDVPECHNCACQYAYVLPLTSWMQVRKG
jgi:hypothetical protein